MNKFFVRLLFAVSLLVGIQPAQAITFPNSVIGDPTGSWTGNFTANETLCMGGAAPEQSSGTMQVDISNYSEASGTFDFTFTINQTLPADDAFTYSFSSTGTDILNLGKSNVLITFQDGGQDYYTWNDTLTAVDANTIDADFTFSWYQATNPSLGCEGNATVTLTRSTGTIVNPEVAPSTAVTSDVATLTQVVTTTTNALAGRIQSALSGLLGGGPRRVGNNYMFDVNTGLAAGDTFQNIGVWGSYAYSDFDNDFSRTKYDGSRHMMFAGVDFSPRDNMVLGVAVGYEDTEIDTDFNFGELDADGWTIAPYFGMILNDTWNIDVSAGWSEVDTDQYRRANSASTTRITSDVDTDRWFLSANINGFTQVDNWLLTGRAGLLNAQSNDDDFTEVGTGALTIDDRTTNLTQVTIGGEAAYSMGNFEPYVSAYYNNDLHATKTVLTAGAQPSNDNDDVLVGVGFRYFKDDNLSVSAQLDSRQGRSDIDETTFTINARWDF